MLGDQLGTWHGAWEQGIDRDGQRNACGLESSLAGNGFVLRASLIVVG